MSDEDERWQWHDQRGVTWAAGAAALALIVLLIVAVLRTAPHEPAVTPSEMPDTTASTTRAGATSSAPSYPVPSVQTSEGDGSEAPPVPSGDAPASVDPPTPTTPSTPTLTNPYVTTTTQNGGAV